MQVQDGGHEDQASVVGCAQIISYISVIAETQF